MPTIHLVTNNYAHFHGIPTTAFAPETVTTFLPNFSPAGNSPASEIRAAGTLAVGATVKSGTIATFHSEEIAGDKNGFGLSFFLTGGNPPTTAAVISGLPSNILRPLNSPDTPLFQTEFVAASPKLAEGLKRVIPWGRLGVPDDVAPAVVFLASDEASYMTGESINLSGGLLMD